MHFDSIELHGSHWPSSANRFVRSPAIPEAPVSRRFRFLSCRAHSPEKCLSFWFRPSTGTRTCVHSELFSRASAALSEYTLAIDAVCLRRGHSRSWRNIGFLYPTVSGRGNEVDCSIIPVVLRASFSALHCNGFAGPFGILGPISTSVRLRLSHRDENPMGSCVALRSLAENKMFIGDSNY